MAKKSYFCKYARGSYILACEIYGYDQNGSRFLKSPQIVVDFRNNQLETSDPKVQALIEDLPWFGKAGAEIALLYSEGIAQKVVAEAVDLVVDHQSEPPSSGPDYTSGPMAVGDEVSRGKGGRFQKKK